MKPIIMILGTDHFDKMGLQDYSATQQLDIQSSKKQAEISEVIDCLKEFAPTKIALEYPYKSQAQLTKSYQKYISGHLALTINECHQLGFRLAEQMGHRDIYAIDWNEEIAGIPDAFDYAATHETTISKSIFQQLTEITGESNDRARSSTMKEYILFHNQTAQIERNHRIYMDLALVGDKNSTVGIQWICHYWYYRNFLIYKKIAELAEAKEERILAIYGAGHLYLLQQFIRESDRFILEYPSTYLKN
ncbi:DUF5694 domain-containing protein [Bacillus sp. 1P06AnD]|uniref:DUF5694 domain-containing protein n=1 Tax=Bacillus sp. 1P06AnD TaxID=3132208 RepID=UPI0039A0C09F